MTKRCPPGLRTSSLSVLRVSPNFTQKAGSLTAFSAASKDASQTAWASTPSWSVAYTQLSWGSC